jgi:hypothetical protein
VRTRAADLSQFGNIVVGMHQSEHRDFDASNIAITISLPE